jgi:hypothetical protein
MNFEYKQIEVETNFRMLSGTGLDSTELTKKLNELGQDGWELVSIYTIEKVKGGTKIVVAALKRQIA